MMCARTGFRHHSAGVEGGQELDELLAADLLPETRFAAPILTVQVERMLAKVDADQRDVLHECGLLKNNTLPRCPR